jgi:hypothetical protein
LTSGLKKVPSNHVEPVALFTLISQHSSKARQLQAVRVDLGAVRVPAHAFRAKGGQLGG